MYIDKQIMGEGRRSTIVYEKAKRMGGYGCIRIYAFLKYVFGPFVVSFFPLNLYLAFCVFQ